MQKSLEELAKIVGGKVLNPRDNGVLISGVAEIEAATKQDIIFAVAPHLDAAESSQAGAVVVPSNTKTFPLPAILADNPREAFIKLVNLFVPKVEYPVEISKQAFIAAGAQIGKDVTIRPFAVIEEGAVIGSNVVIYPHVYVGKNVRIGDNTVLYANVSVRENCVIGTNVIVHCNAVIGADGFGFVTNAEHKHLKVPQVGNVVVEDDVEIGAQTAIDRAALGSTRIRKGTKIDNLVHIGHGCDIGEDCLLVAQTGISGSTKVGNRVTFGGQTGTVGHIEIGENSIFAARTGIIGSVPAGSFYSGFPARPHREWLKMVAATYKLPTMLKNSKRSQKDS